MYLLYNQNGYVILFSEKLNREMNEWMVTDAARKG